MSYSPPEPPPDPPPNRRPLDFDDFMGIFIAFTSIGAILWWSFSQLEKGIDLSFFQSLSSSPPPTTTSPQVTATPREVPAAIPPKIKASPLEGLQPSPSVSPVPSPPPVVERSRDTVPVVPIPVPIEKTQTVPARFSDVPPDFWASPFIAVLVQRGIMEGYPDNTFRPDRPVTRAEFANILQRAFDRSKERQTIDFKDLQSNERATAAIDKAVEMGFMKGYPGEVFRPDQPIPKVESLVALTNGINLAKSPASESALSFYQDADQIPRYAVDEVAAATRAGLVVNHPEPKILEPRQAIDRAEAAALIYQGLVQSGQAQKISSDYIVQP